MGALIMDESKELAALRAAFLERLRADRARFYGAVRPSFARYADDYHWDLHQQDFRLDQLARHGIQPGTDRILDLAAGCGQFVLRALERGYDCYGVEPGEWRVRLFEERGRLISGSDEWTGRVRVGVGERLPFEDGAFDWVTSYQTLEHVQDPGKVLEEMIRVTRAGGGILLQCPDYRSTFEPHYQLPWLPLMPRSLAASYLRVLGRPRGGLDGIQYITPARIRRWLRAISRDSDRTLVVTDWNRAAFDAALRRRGLPAWGAGFLGFRSLQYLKGLFRAELSTHLVIRVD
jgi:SAM-dependent methyltransferase